MHAALDDEEPPSPANQSDDGSVIDQGATSDRMGVVSALHKDAVRAQAQVSTGLVPTAATSAELLWLGTPVLLFDSPGWALDTASMTVHFSASFNRHVVAEQATT